MNRLNEMKTEENYDCVETDRLIESSAQRIILAVAEEFGIDINSKGNAPSGRRRPRATRRNAMDLVHHPASTCVSDIDDDEHTLIWMYDLQQRSKTPAHYLEDKRHTDEDFFDEETLVRTQHDADGEGSMTSHHFEDKIPIHQSFLKQGSETLLSKQASTTSFPTTFLRKDTVSIEGIHKSQSCRKSFLGISQQEDKEPSSENEHEHYEFVKRNDECEDLQMEQTANIGANPIRKFMKIYNRGGQQWEEQEELNEIIKTRKKILDAAKRREELNICNLIH